MSVSTINNPIESEVLKKNQSKEVVSNFERNQPPLVRILCYFIVTMRMIHGLWGFISLECIELCWRGWSRCWHAGRRILITIILSMFGSHASLGCADHSVVLLMGLSVQLWS